MRLRKVDVNGAGLTRRRRGRGFSYHRPDGSAVTDPETLDRIRALAIPPAWREVWICPLPNGHIQAVGTDDAGRRQYRYHDQWRIAREGKVIAMASRWVVVAGRRHPRQPGAYLGAAAAVAESG